jgi:hypothetical protein
VAEENKYAPSVTTAEIADWEKRFKESVSPLVQFDSEEGKPSMKLYNGTSGIEATWSGNIVLKADNYVKWTFSIQNEPFVEAKFTLDAESKKIIDGLYEFYNIWRDEWSKSLSIPPSADKVAAGAELPAQGPPAVPGTAATTPAPSPVTEAYNKGANRNRSRLIEDHSDRMRKLAGI